MPVDALASLAPISRVNTFDKTINVGVADGEVYNPLYLALVCKDKTLVRVEWKIDVLCGSNTNPPLMTARGTPGEWFAMATDTRLSVVPATPSGSSAPSASRGSATDPARRASSTRPARLHEEADVIHLRALALAGDDEAHALEGLGRPGGELVTVRVGGDVRVMNRRATTTAKPRLASKVATTTRVSRRHA